MALSSWAVVGLLLWRGTYLTARSVIAVEVVSLLLVAALIVVIFARLGTETLRATNPGASPRGSGCGLYMLYRNLPAPAFPTIVAGLARARVHGRRR
jgi:hypothetical protein